MAKRSQQTWTTRQLINYSEGLANAYCPGIQKSTQATNDRWTTQRLLAMSAANAFPYR